MNQELTKSGRYWIEKTPNQSGTGIDKGESLLAVGERRRRRGLPTKEKLNESMVVERRAKRGNKVLI